MERKCPYCGSTIDEKSQYCHICGTPLDVVQNKLGQKPQTIEELQAWYTDHHLPPEEVTRFFIGKNILEPKAFGVYKNEVGEFVVYKNKASGERAIRYRAWTRPSPWVRSYRNCVTRWQSKGPVSAQESPMPSKATTPGPLTSRALKKAAGAVAFLIS